MEDNHMHATAGGKEESTITRPFGRRPSSVALPFLSFSLPLSLSALLPPLDGILPSCS